MGIVFLNFLLYRVELIFFRQNNADISQLLSNFAAKLKVYRKDNRKHIEYIDELWQKLLTFAN